MIGPNVIEASSAKTVTGTSKAMQVTRGGPAIAGQQRVTVGLDVTAVSGTTPSMTVTLEWSFDGGTTWYLSEPIDTFAAITVAGKVAKAFEAKGGAFRLRWTISGTTPSFTFSASEAQH